MTTQPPDTSTTTTGTTTTGTTTTGTGSAVVAKMSVPTLTAMVVGGMVGAGVFSLPEFLGRENSQGTPIIALVVTSIAVQALLVLTLFVSDALNFMLDLCTSLSLIPYFLAAAFAFKLAMSGETYETDTPNVQRNQSIIAGVATVGVVGLWTGRITV